MCLFALVCEPILELQLGALVVAVAAAAAAPSIAITISNMSA